MSMNVFKRDDANRMEDELRQTLRSVSTMGVGNSNDMEKMQQMLNTGVTAAHDDVGKALDKAREEAHQLVERIDKAIDDRKRALQEDGQKIAYMLESGMQELRRMVTWLEEETPRLHNPKLEPKQKNSKAKPSTLLLEQPSDEKPAVE